MCLVGKLSIWILNQGGFGSIVLCQAIFRPGLFLFDSQFSVNSVPRLWTMKPWIFCVISLCLRCRLYSVCFMCILFWVLVDTVNLLLWHINKRWWWWLNTSIEEDRLPVCGDLLLKLVTADSRVLPLFSHRSILGRMSGLGCHFERAA